MASSPNTEIEVEFWDDGDDDDEQADDTTAKHMELEIQKQIAAEIKQQQMEQQALQQQRDENYSSETADTQSLNVKPAAFANKLADRASYCYNDIITLSDGREGKIKFIGTLGLQSETWFGLILSSATGTHNGIVKQRRYWKCKANHGTFIRRNQIKSIKQQRIGARFAINEKVKTPKGKAWIRFIGVYNSSATDQEPEEEFHEDHEQDDHSQVVYGVELVDQIGENSGSMNNEYYFQCAHYRGMFYAEEELIWLPPGAPATPRVRHKKSKRSRKKRGADSQEIIALGEDNESIDFEDLSISKGLMPADPNQTGGDDEDEESFSLSDSSSDDEYLSSDEVKRISLTAGQHLDDRLSFARILTDFKNVQKENVRSIAKRYENLTKAPAARLSQVQRMQTTEAEIARDLIRKSKRKRAETLPHNNAINAVTSSPVYQPPRFADQTIDQSKQYKKEKKLTHSNPVSPTSGGLKDRRGNMPPNQPPLKTSSSVNTPSGFNKVAPVGRKGRGKAGKTRRKVKWTEMDSPKTQPNSNMASPLGLYPDSSTPSPISLSPAISLNNPQTIHEESDVIQEDPSSVPGHAASGSRGSIEKTMTVLDSYDDDEEIPKPKKAKEPLPPVRVASDSSIGDELNVGYMSPGIISPGGGVPSLKLQNSASLEAKHDEAMAVVEDMTSTEDRDGNAMMVAMISVESADYDEKNNKSPKVAMSPTGSVVYSWVFKPADEKDIADGQEFKLKNKPDSPFDVQSTPRDFQKVAEILMLECNNPKNLFKVLKGVCAKLKLPNPKYRRIDTQNHAVQQKLLRFDGAEDFLILLGFKQTINAPNFWVCDMDQPPLSVLEAAITVCNDCLLKCNQKQATIDMLKKFSKNDLALKKKKKSGKRKSKNKKSSNKRSSKQETTMLPLQENKEIAAADQEPKLTKSQLSVSVDGTKIQPAAAADYEEDEIKAKSSSSHLSPQLSIQDSYGYDDMGSSDNLTLPNLSLRTDSIRMDDATDTLDDQKFEDELDGDEDRFQLSEIIWSITHKDNSDKNARAIILLCFPTFSDSQKLLKCLIERFFEPDESKLALMDESSRRDSVSVSDSAGTQSATHSPKSSTIASSSKFPDISGAGYHRIESLWEVQVKVISFLQQWMRTYWEEDWDLNDKLLDIVDQFCVKIENCYKSDPNLSEKDVKKGMKLIKMIHQTMDFQEASLRSQKKREHTARQGSVPTKLHGLSDMQSVVTKMRYDFVKVDNRRLAEQITLLDFKYFAAIKKRECLGQAWKKRNKYEMASNICALIDQFNKMSKWVQATILLAKDVKTRGRLIKKFIKVSNELLALRNFQSLCAFHGALSSVPIHKLKHAWSYVPAKHIARFEEMKVIFNTRNNMGNLRKLHREAHAPLVPYTGIFLSDLVSIEEGNKKNKDDGSVNFAKLMRLSNAIDNILLYQRTTYEVEDDAAIQSLLLEDFKCNAKLDADYIYRFSADVAKKDQPMKKRSMLALFSSKQHT